MKRLGGVLAAVVVLNASSAAWAGGYDTPMLYSARHMGMGGTANAFVKDPSAMFHNPAGLANIKKLSLLGNFSLLVGGIKAAPAFGGQSIDSNTVVAPFFLLGAGYRVVDWLVLGFAVYPIASASGAYEYKSPTGGDVENSTTLVFIETTVGAAVNIDAANLRIGAGYRMTYVSLKRKWATDGVPALDFDMKGFNFLGLRVGAQWDAIPKHLSIGVSYRHKTVTEVSADEITIPAFLGGKATGAKAEFTLPSRLIFGVRGDYANFGAAVDLEYAFNSQNEKTVITGMTSTGEKSIPNIFQWDNAITLRVGGEYRIALGEKAHIIPRLGFIYDARTSQKKFPTAFGTPPAPTYVITLGAGYERGPYNVNLAYAYRVGTATIADSDLDSTCTFCSKEGDYKIALNGIYVDFSYDFQ